MNKSNLFALAVIFFTTASANAETVDSIIARYDTTRSHKDFIKFATQCGYVSLAFAEYWKNTDPELSDKGKSSQDFWASLAAAEEITYKVPPTVGKELSAEVYSESGAGYKYTINNMRTYEGSQFKKDFHSCRGLEVELRNRRDKNL